MALGGSDLVLAAGGLALPPFVGATAAAFGESLLAAALGGGDLILAGGGLALPFVESLAAAALGGSALVSTGGGLALPGFVAATAAAVVESQPAAALKETRFFRTCRLVESQRP